MEEHSMRKVISDLDEEERQALLVLADFGSASFSAGLVVEVLRLFINLIT
jgi:dihydroxyacetone kinase DhaKLM complex PTS-EIIA-like component DhaM